MVLGAEAINVGNDTNKGDRDSPKNDQSQSSAVRDGSPDALLVRVETQVRPDDVIGSDLRVLVRHPVGLVVRQALRGEVRGDLLVEEDERGVERWVGLIFANTGTVDVCLQFGTAFVEKSVAFDYFRPGPFDRIDFLADKG